MISLDDWQAAIDNIEDNVFINQPANRKQAFKNKFGAVFNMLNAGNYDGAVEKLADDILKKLDADGEADWVREPALIDELGAFIGMLRHKTN